jgi:hypothetical protein
VRMNAERRFDRGPYLFHDLKYMARDGAAVGVAEDYPGLP